MLVLELVPDVIFMIQKWWDGGKTKKAGPLIRKFSSSKVEG